jgi:hypothetical protein
MEVVSQNYDGGTPHSGIQAGYVLYRFMRIPAGCMTMMQRTLMHGKNAGKATGCGKYKRAKLNYNVLI